MSNAFHSLSEQKVVILGGNSGIGAGVAFAALEKGAEVFLASRRTGHQQPLSTRLHYLQADITQASSLQALFAEVGHFDHLVITAGPDVKAKSLAETSLDDARQNFEVKFWGALQAVQLALPHLAEKGSITLTSGLLSRKFVAGQIIKTTLNAALEASGKLLAKELAPRRVNVVSPGVTATEAYDTMSSEQRQAMFDRVGAGLPVGRVGQPADLASAYLLLMENGFMTGTVIDVDGGGLL